MQQLKRQSIHTYFILYSLEFRHALLNESNFILYLLFRYFFNENKQC